VRKVHSGQTIAAPAQTDIAASVEADIAASIETDIAAEGGLLPRLRTLEDQAVGILRTISLPLLRLAIGAVFIWFGALKLNNSTPVADFVANTLPWFNRAWLVPALGAFEVAIGIALLSGRFVTLVCAALVAHLTGTFLSLIMQPDVTFQHGNPLMLTTEGEFVVKNLVFIAAGLVIAARFNRREPAEK
jgi:putative oxidoreductase